MVVEDWTVPGIRLVQFRRGTAFLENAGIIFLMEGSYYQYFYSGYI